MGVDIANIVRAKSIIVGIDSGITTGVAVLDTNGKILVIKSWRNVKRGELIKFIMGYGRPLVIASDVRPAPKNVRRVAHSLGCRLFTPEIEMSVLEKSKLTKRYADSIKNSHENDALAAAIKAYNMHSQFFARVKRALSKFGLGTGFDEVTKSVMSRKSSSVREGVIGWVRKRGKPEKRGRRRKK